MSVGTYPYEKIKRLEDTITILRGEVKRLQEQLSEQYWESEYRRELERQTFTPDGAW